ELDVDDPAAPDLEVVPRRRAIEALVPQLALHAEPQVVEALGVRRPALVRRLAGDRDDTGAEIALACASPRLHEGLTLPRLGALGLVPREALERHHEQALAAGRPEPRVELVSRALGVRRLEQAHHALGHTRRALGAGFVGRLVD